MIFNIGANVYFPIEETTSRVFKKVWEMAAYAGFLCGKEAARYMKERNSGSIFLQVQLHQLGEVRDFQHFLVLNLH